MKKKIIRLTEQDVHNMIKEGVRRVLKEAHGYVPNDGNSMVGGYWYSNQENGWCYFPYDEYADYLLDAGLINSEEEAATIHEYLNAHENDFVINASCDSGEDESTNYSWAEVEPDEKCLEAANKAIEECPYMNDEAKAKCIEWNNTFFNEDACEYDTYQWNKQNEEEYDYERD